MLDNIYIVTDLGPGDGGKGSVVHALAHLHDAALIIKRGGAQGSHGVRTSAGEKFNFSQWGCGTLEGVPTYCSEQMVLSPLGLLNEADALRHMGIFDPFAMLTVDPLCICATPLHVIASQLNELRRADKPRGTIGSGVGQAYRMAHKYDDELTITASELKDRDVISKKLWNQADYYRGVYADYPKENGIPDDTPLIQENLSLLYDDNYVKYAIEQFTIVGQKLSFANLSDVLAKYNGSAIVECSHGVLTDAETGLKPHVSAIRTLPKFTNDMLKNAGYTRAIFNIAVHRAYTVRHGAGPVPTYDPQFTSRMLPASHKDDNRWQGAIRAGALDMNLLRYALRTSHETTFDGLCLTWFDQLIALGRTWDVCHTYETPMRDTWAAEDFAAAKPVVSSSKIPVTGNMFELFTYADHTVGKPLGIPMYMLSIGPTEFDKITPRP